MLALRRHSTFLSGERMDALQGLWAGVYYIGQDRGCSGLSGDNERTNQEKGEEG